MKNFALASLIIILAACSGDDMTNDGDLSYKRYGDQCEMSKESFWLIDLYAETESDSVFIDTRSLERKAEFGIDQVNMNSHLFQLLRTVCKGDSIFVVISADSFYASLKSHIPPFLKKGSKVQLMVNIHDRLDSNSYIGYKQSFEKERMRDYVDKFGWNPVLDTATYIYYEKLRTTRSVDQGFKKAKFKYILKTIDEQLISFSKDNEPWEYDTADTSILSGLAFLAKRLNEGESLQALIPSNMAFGPNGKEMVKPFTPIIVELEYLQRLE